MLSDAPEPGPLMLAVVGDSRPSPLAPEPRWWCQSAMGRHFWIPSAVARPHLVPPPCFLSPAGGVKVRWDGTFGSPVQWPFRPGVECGFMTVMKASELGHWR